MRKVNNDDAMKIIDRSRREPHDDIRIDHLMGTKCCHYAKIYDLYKGSPKILLYGFFSVEGVYHDWCQLG